MKVQERWSWAGEGIRWPRWRSQWKGPKQRAVLADGTLAWTLEQQWTLKHIQGFVTTKHSQVASIPVFLIVAGILNGNPKQ